MDRKLLLKKIDWATRRVSTDTLIWVYDILCNNIDFTMGGNEDETGTAVGHSRAAGTDDGEEAAEGTGVCESGTV